MNALLLTSSLLLVSRLSPAPLNPAAAAPQVPATGKAGSVRNFVQGFYTWYALTAAQLTSGSPLAMVLHHQARWFSPELNRKLRADWQAQATAKQEVDALDFDPFLNSQDPDPYYRVGRVTSKGQRYLVAVHRVIAGKVEKQRTVTAEVAGKEGH